MIRFDSRKLILSVLMVVFSLSATAQQPHFIYLQTDNGQPFYTKLNGKLLSSTAEGFVILSGVTNGDYKLTVGFPKNELPEETFQIRVDNKNEGYLIKNFDDKGLQLFNLQTMALVDGTTRNTAAGNAPNDNDAFSIALAGAVKDSSILQDHQASGVSPVVPITTGVVAATAAGVDKPDLKPGSEPSTPSKIVAVDSVSKIMSTQSDEGLQMAYQVKTDSSADTVNVLIPVEKNQVDSSEANNRVAVNTSPGIQSAPSVAASAVVASGAIAANATDGNKTVEGNTKQEPVTGNGVAPPSNVDSATTIVQEKNADTALHNLPDTSTAVAPAVVKSSVNSDCKDFATENDFLKLRSKMAEESDNDKMIRLAIKYFQKKCYSTAQIKNLSYIFLTNEAKYQFLESAYPFVSDGDQYPGLASQFTDDYYLNRFKALVSK